MIIQTFLFSIFFIVVTLDHTQAKENSCQISEIEAKLQTWLVSIKDYHILALIKMNDLSVLSQIYGQKPNLLQIQLSIEDESGKPFTQTTVFDGQYQWVETKSPIGTQALKLNLSELTTQERPFDSGYYMMGSSLLNGEDFPTTIEKLITLYDLTANCSDLNITLSGPINPEKLRQYSLIKNSLGKNAINVARFTKNFGFLTMKLDPSNGYRIRGYAMGPHQTKSNFNVQYQKIGINQGVDSSKFIYTAPPGIDVIDITDSVKEQSQD